MKKLLTLAVLLGLLGVVAGCNQGGDGTTTADTNAPATSTTTNQ